MEAVAPGVEEREMVVVEEDTELLMDGWLSIDAAVAGGAGALGEQEREMVVEEEEDAGLLMDCSLSIDAVGAGDTVAPAAEEQE